jgi:hypothetical protein
MYQHDMRWSVLAIALLVGVQVAEAQPGTSKSGGVPPRASTGEAPPTPLPPIPGHPPFVRMGPGTRPSSPTTTPFNLSGQTVCSRGPVDERPVSERSHWFDGATVGLPGYRCITLQ